MSAQGPVPGPARRGLLAVWLAAAATSVGGVAEPVSGGDEGDEAEDGEGEDAQRSHGHIGVQPRQETVPEPGAACSRISGGVGEPDEEP